MGMRVIVLQTLTESLARIHDTITGIRRQSFEIWIKVSWGNAPKDILPRGMPYLTTNCSVHFKTDTFTHNDHDGYVHFLRIWLTKGFRIKMTWSFFFNVWLPVVYSWFPHVITLPTRLYMKSIPGRWPFMNENCIHNFMPWKLVRKYLQLIFNSSLWIPFLVD